MEMNFTGVNTNPDIKYTIQQGKRAAAQAYATSVSTEKFTALNPFLLIDYYKSVHAPAYVPGLDYLVSYWTPRKSRIEGIDKVVMFDLQAVCKQHLMVDFYINFFNRPWEDLEAEYKRMMRYTMTEQAADISHMKAVYDLGYLPIEIRAVAEGTRVNMRTPMIEIRNTVAGFGWLVNYLETYLSVNLWHGMTSATIAYEFRKYVNEYYTKTVDGGNPRAACGDFSMRGMTSQEAAARSSAGHLLSFTGSATIPSIVWLESYYNCNVENEPVGYGVPSMEHSVMSSYGREDEFECYRHLIEDVFPKGPLSIVSDTYNYWNVLTDFLPRLKDSIAKRDGKIVIRGDSGDPIDIICGSLQAKDYLVVDGLTEEGIKDYFKHEAENTYPWNGTSESWYNVRIGNNLYKVTCYHEWTTDEDGEGYYTDTVEYVEFEKREITVEERGTVELLMEVFGYTINSKGYKVLPPYIGAIYGDSITLDRLKEIYRRLDDKKIAINNVTLGIGSYTYQYVTRDTFGFALKATHSIINGEERQIFKDPITDKVAGNNFKKSQKGLCYVYREGDDILYKDELSFADMEKPEYADNLLRPVFKDGVLLIDEDLQTIRQRLHKGNF